MDIVNKSELENIFYKLGFTNFIVNEDEEYLNQILEDENSEKIYIVDVLPNRLTEEQCSFLNTLEDYYFEKFRMESIREKWNNILIKFSCYYKLNSIFLIGTGVIWGAIGFRIRNLPFLLLLIISGCICSYISKKIEV